MGHIMHKGIKILGYVVSSLVLATIIIPLALSLLINIRPVQNWAVDQLTRAASRKIGTVVAIDHVDLGLFNRLQVSGFYVEDLQGDTLLYARRIQTGIASFRNLTLGAAQVEGCLLRLAQTPEGEMNIKQVVDRMRGKGGGDFRMAIRQVDIADFRFELHRSDTLRRREGIDFSDLRIFDADIHGRDFSITGDSIAVRLDRMSFGERSGFRLDDMSADALSVAGGRMRFSDLHLASGATDLRFPHLFILGGDWEHYSDFITDVEIDMAAVDSRIDFATLGYFAPSLAGWKTRLSGVDMIAQGRVADMHGRIEEAEFGESSSIELDFDIKGLPEVANTVFRFGVKRLSTRAADVSAVAEDLSGKPLAEGIETMITRAGVLKLRGDFDGRLSAFDAAATLSTMLGSIEGDVRLTENSALRHRFDGTVSTGGFDLGGLLGVASLGEISADAGMTGSFGDGKVRADVDGRIPSLDFNGYRYDSIQLKGSVDNRRFEGYVGCDNSNLDFDFNGSVDYNGPVPRYDFDLKLDRADLHALNFNRRDSVSVLRADLAAHSSGKSFDDMNGRIDIADVRYIGVEDTISTRSIRLHGENDEAGKFLSLNSDFVDASFRSRLSYKTILEYVKDGLFAYLPSLDHSPSHVHRHDTDEAGSIDRYSLLSVNFKRSAALARAILPGLQIADGTSLSFMFNPDNDRFTLKLVSDFIERNNMMVTKINLNANNSFDSLAVYLRSEDFYLRSLHMPDLSVQGGAKNNRISLSAGFNNAEASVSALLGIDADVARASDGRRSVTFHLRPSNIRRGDKTWVVAANKIVYDTSRIDIDRFMIRNSQQWMLLDGVASRSMADSVVLTLHNFDLAPVGQLAESMGYGIEGRSNGRATMHSALKGGRIDGSVLFDSVRVNGTALPPMQALARWDMQRNRARLLLTDRNRADTVVRGYYAPDTKRYYIEAGIDRIPMSLVAPFLDGVVSDMRGYADAAASLTGRGGEAELSGTIAVDSMACKVDFTQVEYTVPQASIDIKNSRMLLPATKFYDRDGNSGTLDMELDLQHLSNISFRVEARPDRMLVMDTGSKDNDLFYGTVYGTGSARITGDKMGVKMDIAAATDDNTQFFLPLSGASSISQADFVVFTTPDRIAADTATTYLTRKKLMYERRHKQKFSGGSNVDISLAMNVRPNAEFQLVIDPTVGDVMRGRGQGTLNMHINPRSGVFDMYGDYEITEGSYQFTLQNVVSKKFIIDAGSTIQWTGEPLDALLNIRAIYRLKASLQPLLGTTSASGAGGSRSAVDCIINLTDRLSKPTVTFGIVVPNADIEVQNVVGNMLNTQEEIANQFIYLLIFNSFVNESGASGSVNFGAVGTATTGFELLSNQVSNWLSSDDYNIIIRYRPKNEKAGDEFDFGFSKSLISDRLIVEVEGNYVADNNTVSGQTNNLMGEAYITWLIDRAGNLKLRGFTQTIDRFDENQGLQESGIGIYYKEDFNTFRDIMRNFKERFANFGKRKREKREAKAAKKAEKEREAAAGDEPVKDTAAVVATQFAPAGVRFTGDDK